MDHNKPYDRIDRVNNQIHDILGGTLIKNIDLNSNESDLFLIGGGSLLFNNNTFYLNDKFHFKSINFYSEIDYQICKSGLVHYLNTQEIRKIVSKKHGIFERFFNYFSK